MAADTLGRNGRRLGISCGVLLAVLAGSCASPERPRPPQVRVAWPAAPASPRVTFVRTIRGTGDLGKPSFFSAVGNLITGPREQTLLRPQGVAVDGEGRLYVTDQERQGVHVFNFNSSKAAFIDRAGDAFLVSPVAVAVCGDRIAVSDSALNEVFLMSREGRLETTFKKPGGFKRPTGLAFDPQRNRLYVVDTLANEVCVFDLSGRLLSRFGSAGEPAGHFNYPTHVFVDGSGKVYVTDSLNFRVQVFDNDGRYLFHIGQLGDATGHLAVPKGVGVDTFGHIYVVDSYLTTVQIFDQRGRFLLAFGEPGAGPGAFQVPTGLTVDPSNRVFVCDSYNSRVQVFQYVGPSSEDASSDN